MLLWVALGIWLKLSQISTACLYWQLKPSNFCDHILFVFVILFCDLILLLAPAGPPLEFTAESTGPTMLVLSWSPPQATLRNGLIASYEYVCADIHSDPQLTDQVNVTIMGLTPFTSYSCSVKAATVNGTGPAANIIITTAEDSM